MRIIGHIPHPIMKITVFKMETRFSVKFEVGTMEQVYRIRQSDHISTFSDIENLINDSFMKEALDHFKAMGKSMKSRLNPSIK